MRLYARVTGALFGLLAVVHVWRMAVEHHLATDPWYWSITGLAAALAIWAWRAQRGVER